MEKILLNRARVSGLVWDLILQSSFFSQWSDRQRVLGAASEMEALRYQAAYDTGSISAAACWVLYSLTRYLKPNVVAEVGTFIGKSTISIVRGMEDGNVEPASIYTCDLSNNIFLNIKSSVQVRQFPLQASSQMFEVMLGEGIRSDLLFIDGRLQAQDFAILGSVMHENTVLVLDDFEGIEKGVSNALSLLNALQQTHILVYPPSHDVLAAHGLLDGCKIALIVPLRLVMFSNQ